MRSTNTKGQEKQKMNNPRYENLESDEISAAINTSGAFAVLPFLDFKLVTKSTVKRNTDDETVPMVNLFYGLNSYLTQNTVSVMDTSHSEI